MNDGLRCFVIITLTTTVVIVGDLIARAFFYEQVQHIAPFLSLLIGSIALWVMGVARRNQKKPEDLASQSNTASIRRVRVTGPVK